MSWIPTIYPHDADEMDSGELLTYVLGERLVAVAIASRDIQDVQKKLHSGDQWSEREQIQIDLLHEICLLISDIHSDVEIIQRWMMSAHPLLQGRSVLQAVRECEEHDIVIHAVQQYVWGEVKMRLVKF